MRAGTDARAPCTVCTTTTTNPKTPKTRTLLSPSLQNPQTVPILHIILDNQSGQEVWCASPLWRGSNWANSIWMSKANRAWAYTSSANSIWTNLALFDSCKRNYHGDFGRLGQKCVSILFSELGHSSVLETQETLET